MLNIVTLMGRLTADPTIRYTTTGNKAVCSFTLAVDRDFVKQGEQRQADFISCQAWDKTAEFASKYFSKGSMIAIVGRMQTRTWDDTEGKKHYATEVVAEKVSFCGGKSNGQAESQPSTQPGMGIENGNLEDDSELPF